MNVRAGHFICTMYDNIHDRISAFNFGFHPLAPKIFKSRKRKLEIQNEEDSKENGVVEVNVRGVTSTLIYVK